MNINKIKNCKIRKQKKVQKKNLTNFKFSMTILNCEGMTYRQIKF